MSSHDARVPVPATAHAAPEGAAPVAATSVTGGPASPAVVAGLTVGSAHDPAEQAADLMADVALERLRRSTADDSTDGADKHAHDPGCGHLRRSVASAPAPAATIGAAGGVLDASTAGQVEGARSAGTPLPGAVRQRMETGFGRGLGHVRVHAGPDAARLSAAMGAEAFATGSDIFFGAGRFAPDTPQGEKVLAHEIAHVLTEPGGVRRWPWSTSTPEEKTEKARKKREEDERAARAKQGKVTVQTQLAERKDARIAGDAGRAGLTAQLYGAGGEVPSPEVGKKTTDLTKRFEMALLREQEVFDESAKDPTSRTDEERAEKAYAQVWETEYADLTSVAPARKTVADRLVSQVRHTRSGAAAGTTAAEVDAATLAVSMLPSAVESAYERMVTHRDDILAKSPKASPALAQEEAWTAVRKAMAPKVLAGFPPKDGPVDLAAWGKAEGRVLARNTQKARDEESITASLALLPEDQRGAPQEKSSPSTAEATVTKVGGYLDKGSAGANVVGGGLAGFVGGSQDKTLREQKGVVKDKEPGSGLPDVVDQGVGATITAGSRAHKQRTTGQRDWTDQELPESDATLAKQGIGQVTGILGGLKDAVASAFQMVRSAKASWETKDPYKGLEAAKSGAAGLDGLVASAKSAADLAKLIDGSVTAGVKSVVPGLDIASSALAMVRGVVDVATAGMRQRETDLTLFEARTESAKKVDVMVYPLMKVSQVYTKHLEQACWSLGVSVLGFSTSVAQVASAGGFGIPAAIKAATAVVDNLHSIAHYIADKVLVTMAKKAEKESAVLHVEGGAEDELRRHPKMAVDGIILKGAAGDKTALMFLAGYRINGKPITPDYVKQIRPKPVKAFDPTAMRSDPKGLGDEMEQTSNDGLLATIREVVLAGMGTSADPQTVYDDFTSKAAPALGLLGGLKKAWTESTTLADQRNAQAKAGKLGDNTTADRGLVWSIGQMLSSKKRGRLAEKTAALGAAETLPVGVVCAVGDSHLKDQAGPPAIREFVTALTVEAIEVELRRTPRRNSPEWTEFLREALREKLTASAMSAGVGA
ncbi:DUF4157 domain-containing protein [Actinotalea sp. K2]|uniref:eCIS core domain-containing protein n=1 Tax=Actinotalea sp. K2 TaxID=2939438 RepID=UPI002016F586|nr:DUF4157 domain-containing protein [Actinotalea sp. K2]MCL3859707.1 DUF4157 domain-containing protein [Actinotalea sp. K2]